MQHFYQSTQPNPWFDPTWPINSCDNVFTLPNFYTIADVQCIISYVCSLG